MTGCELVTVAILAAAPPPARLSRARLRRVCAVQVYRRAAREGAIVVDFRRGGRVTDYGRYANTLTVGGGR